VRVGGGECGQVLPLLRRGGSLTVSTLLRHLRTPLGLTLSQLWLHLGAVLAGGLPLAQLVSSGEGRVSVGPVLAHALHQVPESHRLTSRVIHRLARLGVNGLQFEVTWLHPFPNADLERPRWCEGLRVGDLHGPFRPRP
jgi:hypothetical protein